MVEGSSSPGTNAGSQMSPNTTIAIISSLFILVILYPWIIFVSIAFFIVGFIGLEHVDKFVKTSIVTGRFGPLVQSRYTEYIDLTESSESTKNVIKEVTADPLRDFIEEDKEQEKLTLPQQLNDQQFNLQDDQNIIFENDVGGHQNALIIPARLSSSSRSSPEKNKPLFDSPKRSLSAASSRRVSEDIPSSSSTANNLIAPFAVVGGISGIYPQQQQQHQRLESSNKTPSPSRSSTAGSTPSPSITLNPEIVGTLRVDQEFRVDVRIDQSFGRLCSRIIDYYISPSWAPYETRRQLKLNFKQLLNKVAEQCDRKLLCHKLLKEGESSTSKDVNVNAPIVKLVREKLLPLALHYLDKILTRGLTPKNGTDQSEAPIMTEDSKRRLVLKIRKFCRQIFERFLTKDDKNCKLWMELCIAVLGDGVLVNVMTLGMDKLPELVEELMVRVKKSSRGSLTGDKLLPAMKRSPSDTGSAKNENEFTDPLSEDFHEASQEPFTPPPSSPIPPTGELGEKKLDNEKGSCEKVPFLLDSFLDPPYNLEKPDPIVSRWRPTIRDIVSETDLLYPLIQYMKHVGGQQSLVYLQGVLDEFPQDGDPYCRRVLELEYLPGFCRSNLFLETMGLSRVEMALEVGTDPYSPMRRHSTNTNNSGHARSASYGGPSSSFREFLKIEQGIVDGLPLTESSQQNTSASSSSSDHSSERSTTGSVGGSSVSGASASLPGAGEVQPSLAFKRRPHLEMYIAKFIKSTSKTWKQYYDPLAEQHELAKRIGTEAKSYEEWHHPEVNSRVKIDCSTAEIYDSLIDLGTSLMRSSPIASPFFSGLAVFLKPYLMPIFNEQLEKNLTEVLSEDLLVTVVDLIADVYEEQSDDTTDNDNNSTNIPSSSKDNEYGNFSSFNTLSSNSTSPNCPSSLPCHNTNSTSEEESHEYHNSSCTTCDPSFKSTIKSFLTNILECVMLKLIDLDYFVKCFSRNKEFIFLFFVDLLDVLVEELVEK